MTVSSQPTDENSVSKKPPMINILNFMAFLINVFVMYGLRLFGMNHIYSEFPASFPTLITPASWTRMLWPVIVIIQFLWVIVQILPKYATVDAVTVVGSKYIAVCMAQIAWTLFFSYRLLALSLVAILAMLTFLFVIFRVQSNIETSLRDYFLFKFPFAILFAWTVVATFVDINVLLVAMGVSTTIQFYVAVVSLSGMVIVSGSITDLIVLMVIAWALLGIYMGLMNPDYLVTSVFETSTISTVRVWTLVSFVIVWALIAWQGYSLWHLRSKSIRNNDTGDEHAKLESEGENYISMT